MSDTSGGTPTHALALEPGEELRDVVVCINDCVYGMIEPPAYCAAVIETPLFQRLGRVKQLGNLAHVWPSATHSRLEHSLGTMHLAREYAARLCLRPAEEQALVLASLLHDIGHGPFSHIFETALAGTPSGDAFRHHDAYRVRLIQEDPPLRDALGPRMVAAVLAVWEDSWSEGLPFDAAMCGILHALLAGVAGVDRMDYIIRDLYHTTPHRRLDRTCIQSIMMQTVIDREAGVVLHSQKAERFIQSLLEERRYLFRTVYQHRRCRVVDGLMQQAFRAGVAAAVAPLLRTASDFEQLDDAFIVQLAWDPALPQAARELLLQVLRGNTPPDDPPAPSFSNGMRPADMRHVRFGSPTRRIPCFQLEVAAAEAAGVPAAEAAEAAGVPAAEAAGVPSKPQFPATTPMPTPTPTSVWEPFRVGKRLPEGSLVMAQLRPFFSITFVASRMYRALEKLLRRQRHVPQLVGPLAPLDKHLHAGGYHLWAATRRDGFGGDMDNDDYDAARSAVGHRAMHAHLRCARHAWQSLAALLKELEVAAALAQLGVTVRDVEVAGAALAAYNSLLTTAQALTLPLPEAALRRAWAAGPPELTQTLALPGWEDPQLELLTATDLPPPSYVDQMWVGPRRNLSRGMQAVMELAETHHAATTRLEATPEELPEIVQAVKDAEAAVEAAGGPPLASFLEAVPETRRPPITFIQHGEATNVVFGDN